jgi:drug/metabolite transporter (DMT)-like permease
MQTIDKKYITGVAYAVISSITFGLIPLFTVPLLQSDITSETILFYRFLFATLMLIVVVKVKGCNLKLNFEQLRIVFGLSVLYALTAILLIESYKVIPSGITTTIHFLYPLAVTLIMSWFYGVNASSVTYIALMISIIGVLLLAWGSHDGGNFRIGVLLALGTVATYALYIVGVMKSRASQIDPLVLTLYVLLMCAILFFIYAIITTGIEPIRHYVEWRNLIMVALICTVLSDYTLVLAIKHIGSIMTSILGSMEPVTAVVVGVVYFGEHFDIVSIAGVILIIIAVVMVIVQGGQSGHIITKEDSRD